jgi:hypothetical protein
MAGVLGRVLRGIFGKQPRLLELGCGLRQLFKCKSDAVYEPDRQRLAELLTGVRGASPVWCGGCGELMAPIALSDGEHTKLVAVSCLGPCCVSLPVRAGLLMGGEPAATIQ